ncbi:hypothetical protein O3P69_009801 [Scylla paramamosain]|uniref:Uncharacterized protein n=1 Tax=Scylla paramamosain TaxID=85552 RepID=A0AAW0SM04_SCYPA
MCPGKPTCTWTDWEHQFETFLVTVGGNDFTAIRKKALLLHSLGAEAQRVLHSQPPAIKATGVSQAKMLHGRTMIRSVTEGGLYERWIADAIPNSTTCLSAPNTITVTSRLSLKNFWEQVPLNINVI